MIPEHISFGFVIEPKSKTRPLFEQVHGTEILELTEWPQKPVKADGAITTIAGLEIFAFSADCLPLLFFSEENTGPIAAIHCGWRGARAGIASEAVRKLRCESIHVVLGPCLMNCCFEVKQDFIDSFGGSKDYIEIRDEKTYFRLPDFVREIHLNQIPDSRIHREHLKCTYCSDPPLPSYRRNKGTDPRIRSWIKKRPIRHCERSEAISWT
jgi:YfiH family protein